MFNRRKSKKYKVNTMINSTQKQRLLNNWGARAESMACNAEVRVYDPLSSWQCYILALNPEDENTIMCIVSTNKWAEPMLTDWTLYDLSQLYNSNGEGPDLDKEYRPRRAAELFKLLNNEVIL
jgi:hypothetical protein